MSTQRERETYLEKSTEMKARGTRLQEFTGEMRVPNSASSEILTPECKRVVGDTDTGVRTRRRRYSHRSANGRAETKENATDRRNVSENNGSAWREKKKKRQKKKWTFCSVKLN